MAYLTHEINFKKVYPTTKQLQIWLLLALKQFLQDKSGYLLISENKKPKWLVIKQLI